MSYDADESSAARSHREEVIRQLFLAFPQGATLERIDLYVEATRDLAVADLDAAIKRLIRVGSSQRAPTIGTVLDRAREIAKQRIMERPALEARTRRKPTAAEVAQCDQIRDLARAGWYWCDTCARFRVGFCHYEANRALWRSDSAVEPSGESIARAHADIMTEVPF